MSLAALVAALLLEQWRPLVERRYLFSLAARYAMFLEQQFNAGEAEHGAIAWLIAVLPPVLATWAVYALLWRVSPLLALAFNVVALYFTMGFRQFSHHFTEIHLALKQDDIARARDVLSQWLGQRCDELDREALVRITIEQALVASHRHVFGVVLWFVLLPGPSGAVLYRLAVFLKRRWAGAHTDTGPFGRFSARALALLEWPALRATAVSFAIVGDFEDAVYCWRTQAASWPDPGLGIVLAAGAGAMGVKLGMPVSEHGGLVDRPPLGVGDDADTGFLDSAIGLVWRALILWLMLLLLLGLATVVR
ncbi:MAG TPA: CobD/CbiB family protein [Burkholderiales bacterium]|nr:CobD/CbiB family protein [Burkholderiales bacterium]